MQEKTSILVEWSRKLQATPVFLPGKCRGPRSLAGYRTQGHKELDRPERLSIHYYYAIVIKLGL